MGMAAGKVAISGKLVRRRVGVGNNALHPCSHHAGEDFSHAVAGFAEGDGKNARVGTERIEVITHAQYPTLIREMPRKSLLNTGFSKGMQEHLARSGAHGMTGGHQMASACSPGLKNCLTQW